MSSSPSAIMVIISQLVFTLIVSAVSIVGKSTTTPTSTSTSTTSSTTINLSTLTDSNRPSSVSSQPQLLVSRKVRSDNTFSVRCPLPHLIYPCDCVEIEKGLESEFVDSNEGANGASGDSLTTNINDTSSVAAVDNDGVSSTDDNDEISTNINVNSEPHPDIIETVVFCKHIYSRQQLMDSMKAFKGHRINYLVLDSCSIPPFPTKIFNQINILWMEVLNSTIQFRESFFECGSNCL